MDTLIADSITYYLKTKYKTVIELDDAYIFAYYKYPEICGELGKMALTEENLRGLIDIYDADCVFISYSYTLDGEYIVDDQVFSIKKLLEESFVKAEE